MLRLAEHTREHCQHLDIGQAFEISHPKKIRPLRGSLAGCQNSQFFSQPLLPKGVLTPSRTLKTICTGSLFFCIER